MFLVNTISIVLFIFHNRDIKLFAVTAFKVALSNAAIHILTDSRSDEQPEGTEKYFFCEAYIRGGDASLVSCFPRCILVLLV